MATPRSFNAGRDSRGRSLAVERLEKRTLLSGNGLQGFYFSDPNFSDPVFDRIDSSIGFNWGMGSPGAGLRSDHFSVR